MGWGYCVGRGLCGGDNDDVGNNDDGMEKNDGEADSDSDNSGRAGSAYLSYQTPFQLRCSNVACVYFYT
jgi:hypothetical protein